MPSLNTFEQFITKFKRPRTGQLKAGEDWLFDLLMLLAPITSMTTDLQYLGISSSKGRACQDRARLQEVLMSRAAT